MFFLWSSGRPVFGVDSSLGGTLNGGVLKFSAAPVFRFMQRKMPTIKLRYARTGANLGPESGGFDFGGDGEGLSLVMTRVRHHLADFSVL